MKINRILIAGVVVGILGALWGWATCGNIFNWVYQIEPVSVWKPIETVPSHLVGILGIAFSILFAFVYALINDGIPGKGIMKGVWFGVIAWLVGGLPGIIMTGMFSVIAQEVIIYWVVICLVTSIWQGVVIALIYDRESK